MIGKVLNQRYKIIKELGKGGMAIVFEAQDLLLDRKVALKMLRPEYVNDKNFVKRFRHEAKAVARLSHPNVVNIYDIGQEGNSQYLVMEDVEGKNLKDIINKKGKLEITEALQIAKQISEALVVAHKNNIIHCDIKPHNILLTKDMQVKVTDFGIARAVTSAMTMTITDTIVGSAHYFSPEQARGGEIKACSDLYSLGIVLYEMLTGVVPFRGDSPISVALKHIQETPKRPGLINTEIPENVENIVMKAIAKNPADRFVDADEMKKSIELALDGFVDNTSYNYDDGDTKVIERIKIKNQTNGKSDKKYLTYYEKGKVPVWVKWSVVILVFFFISILGLYIFYRNFMNVPIVEVPNIVGMEYEEARKEALQVGLHLETQNDGIYHPEIPENFIISQSPKGGERVRQTRKITVTLSLGPHVLIVPDLRNMAVREAGVFLENRQLSIGKIEEVYSEEVGEGLIISQNPLPDEEANVDTQINIVVSQGPQPNMMEVPNIIGLYLDDAINKLEESGFRSGEISEKMTKRFMVDQVAEQKYSAGELIPEGSRIDLVVSSGLINSEGAAIHKGVTMRFSVPAGNWNQDIEIVIIDNNGRDTIYEGIHHPGDFIQVYFNSVGSTRYEIFINGQLRYDGPLEE